MSQEMSLSQRHPCRTNIKKSCLTIADPPMLTLFLEYGLVDDAHREGELQGGRHGEGAPRAPWPGLLQEYRQSSHYGDSTSGGPRAPGPGLLLEETIIA